MKKTRLTKNRTFMSILSLISVCVWILSVILLGWIIFNSIGYALVADSIVQLARQSISGMTTTMQHDLEMCEEVLEKYKLCYTYFSPIFIISLGLIAFWFKEEKS